MDKKVALAACLKDIVEVNNTLLMQKRNIVKMINLAANTKLLETEKVF